LARGHLEVAAAIAADVADAGVTIRLAANLYGLRFQSWREERYDLVIPASEFESAPVQILMEALNSRALAREIESLCGYDASQMGQVVTQGGA
jgi:molybdate-binding protein